MLLLLCRPPLLLELQALPAAPPLRSRPSSVLLLQALGTCTRQHASLQLPPPRWWKALLLSPRPQLPRRRRRHIPPSAAFLGLPSPSRVSIKAPEYLCRSRLGSKAWMIFTRSNEHDVCRKQVLSPYPRPPPPVRPRR